MKIYTRTGDDGTTSLAGGQRVPKFHPRVEAYGSVDELIAWTGLIFSSGETARHKEFLLYLIDQLMKCAGLLASGNNHLPDGNSLPDPQCVAKLEKEIDRIGKPLKKLENFILPPENVLISWCNIARTVCRRAERQVLKLNQTEQVPEPVVRFLNRLGDYLFVLSRKLCLELDIEEVEWSV